MSTDDSHYSENYFQALATLAERLARKRIALYEHKFDLLSFGNWEIVAGRRKKMLSFSYDAKESCLSYCDAAVRPHHGSNDVHARRLNPEENPFNTIADILENEFAK